MCRASLTVVLAAVALASPTLSVALDVQQMLNAQQAGGAQQQTGGNAGKPAADVKPSSLQTPTPSSGCQMETLLLRAAKAQPGAVDEIDLQVSEAILKPRAEFTLSMKMGSEVAKCVGATTGPVLFLDHLPIQGLASTGRLIENGRVQVRFRLDRPASSLANWNELLQRAWSDGKDREVVVGIGGGDAEVAVAAKPVKLRLGGGGPAVGVGALIVCVLLLALVWWQSKALVDRKSGYLSYSLSRLVLACWVLTTSAAIVLMLLHTGVLPSVADGGLAFMVAATGLGTGASAWIDRIKTATNPDASTFIKDFFEDGDGFALHRVQAAILNSLVLYVVWSELVRYGTVAYIDKSWAVLVGASTVTYLLGKSGESLIPTIEKQTS